MATNTPQNGLKPPFRIVNMGDARRCEIGDDTNTFAASCGVTFAEYAVPRLNKFDRLYAMVKTEAMLLTAKLNRGDGIVGDRELLQRLTELLDMERP